MSKWSVLGFPVAASGAALLVVVFAPNPCTTAAASRSWEPAETVGWADPAQAELGRELDAERRAVRARIEERTLIAQAVLCGDLTFDEAVARFEQLNSENGVALAILRHEHPGASDEELVCRQVVRVVRLQRTQASAEVDAVLTRLEAEIARRFSALSPQRPGPAAH